MPINVSDFLIQPPPARESEGLVRLGQTSERLAERKQQKLEQNRMFNLRQLDSETDADKYKTGDQALDAYSQKELKAITDKALANYINLDPAEMKFRLNNDINDFMKWHSAATAKSNEIKSQLADFNKTYPNVNYEQAHLLAYKNLESDFLDENGNRRSPDYINMNRDYVGELHNPEVLSQITNDISPAQRYYSSSAKQPFHERDFTSIKGVKNMDKFSGVFSPDKQEIVADQQGNPTLDVKHEIVPSATKNGEPLKIIDENQFLNISQNPSVYAAFLKKWATDPSAEGRQAIEQKYMQKNNGKPMDETFKTIAFKHWLYEDAKKNLDTYISRDKAEVTPITKIYNGPQSADVNVRNIYEGIKNTVKDARANGISYLTGNKLESSQTDIALEAANKKYPDLKLGQDDIKVGLDNNDNVQIFFSDKYLSDNTGIKDPLITTLSEGTTNLKAQPRAKEKVAVIAKENANKGQTTTTTHKTVKVPGL